MSRRICCLVLLVRKNNYLIWKRRKLLLLLLPAVAAAAVVVASAAAAVVVAVAAAGVVVVVVAVVVAAACSAVANTTIVVDTAASTFLYSPNDAKHLFQSCWLSLTLAAPQPQSYEDGDDEYEQEIKDIPEFISTRQNITVAPGKQFRLQCQVRIKGISPEIKLC